MSARQLSALAVVPPLLAFGTLMVLAMTEYPGGTWEDPQALGHSQGRNFLCDLTRPTGSNQVEVPHANQMPELGRIQLRTPRAKRD